MTDSPARPIADQYATSANLEARQRLWHISRREPPFSLSERIRHPPPRSSQPQRRVRPPRPDATTRTSPRPSRRAVFRRSRGGTKCPAGPLPSAQGRRRPPQRTRRLSSRRPRWNRRMELRLLGLPPTAGGAGSGVHRPRRPPRDQAGARRRLHSVRSRSRHGDLVLAGAGRTRTFGRVGVVPCGHRRCARPSPASSTPPPTSSPLSAENATGAISRAARAWRAEIAGAVPAVPPSTHGVLTRHTRDSGGLSGDAMRRAGRRPVPTVEVPVLGPGPTRPRSLSTAARDAPEHHRSSVRRRRPQQPSRSQRRPGQDRREAPYAQPRDEGRSQWATQKSGSAQSGLGRLLRSPSHRSVRDGPLRGLPGCMSARFRVGQRHGRGVSVHGPERPPARPLAANHSLSWATPAILTPRRPAGSGGGRANHRSGPPLRSPRP